MISNRLQMRDDLNISVSEKLASPLPYRATVKVAPKVHLICIVLGLILTTSVFGKSWIRQE